MQHSSDFFNGVKNQQLFAQYWLPDESPRAIILLVHGVAEHSGRYRRLAEHLSERGFALCAYDQPGHGQSEGVKGHLDKFSNLTESLRLFQEKLQQQFPNIPMYILGHSMGSLVSLKHLIAEQHRYEGAILSAAALISPAAPGKAASMILRILASIVPKLGAIQLEAEGVSRDPKEVEKYINDPLNYTGKLSAKLIIEMLDTANYVIANLTQLELPIICLHGDADGMTSPEGSKTIIDSASSNDKTLTLYSGLYHEILNEPEREQVMTDVSNWLAKHIDQ